MVLLSPAAHWFGLIRTAAVAAIGGGLFFELGTPLPWLLGSLAATGVLGLLGRAAKLPSLGVRSGQITIGIALGLYFTPTVLLTLWSMLGWILASALLTCLLSLAGAVFLQRLTQLDSKTCFYAAAIGAASDMAIQANRQGARGDLVAIAHSVRVTLVVSIVPVVAAMLEGHGQVDRSLASQGVVYLPILPTLGLMALASVVGWAASKTRFPNPWVLGPLFVAIGAAFALPDHRLDAALVAAGQVLLGWNLGQRFTLKLFQETPRLVLAASTMTLAFGAVCLIMATLVHFGAGLGWTSAFVATCPGGIAEMAITAKVLGLDPPTVTAFHAVRLILMVAGAGLLMRLGFWLGWLRPNPVSS